MLLDSAHEQLGWPTPEDVLSPTGEGARFYAQLAKEKIGKALSRRPDGQGVEIGVLSTDPEATGTPVALVCVFHRKVSDETLREAQKLAWNFGCASLLITIEPHVLRTWTCCEPPEPSSTNLLIETPEIEPSIDFSEETKTFLSEQAAASLHWVELLTEQFFQKHAMRFRPEKRADQMLLANLREIRQKLQEAGLTNDDTAHDLLARIIFIQFLFDRKDSDGKAALNPTELGRLYEEGILSARFTTLGEILSSYEDTYALFRWLNDRFNGDLFPGKGNESEQAAAWEVEQTHVRPEHLSLLSRFVRGEQRMRDGQLALWPYYAFDAIPLEVISTIYEQFVRKDAGTGVHYTPSHVADLILDSVLPWSGDEWDLKVLDPSCGSGVFLVKAYQRLIHRWKVIHPEQKINGEVLANILEHNIFGVDLDAHAVRTASFSLYLAMCDEIDPRDYWREVHFPVLRGRRLIAADFFSEEYSGFRTIDGAAYDVVIGNPPWGKNTATPLARDWQRKNHWPLSYGDVGPLFLVKALALTQDEGYVALIQPASTLLYNSAATAEAFRTKLLMSYRVEEIFNFAALRFVLFRDAIVPACAIVIQKVEATGEPFWYVCPKPRRNREDRFRIIIEPQDTHRIFPSEVAESPWVWSALLWGSRRDLAFLGRLRWHKSLADLESEGLVKVRQGIIRGTVSTEYPELLQKRLLSARSFPSDESIWIEASKLPVNTDPRINSVNSHDFSVFMMPQLVIKQSWKSAESRFRAGLVFSNEENGFGVICTDSYLSVHADIGNKDCLEVACLAYNSSFAVFYLLLTSGRFAMDRNEPQAEAFRSLPLPIIRPGLLDNVEQVSDVDERAFQAYAFKEAEWLLVEDLMQFTLPDYKGGSNSPGRQPTLRRSKINPDTIVEPELTQYCETFLRVLRAAYGKDKSLGAVIYSEPDHERLPVRMVSLFLNLPEAVTVQVEPMASASLRQRLTMLYHTMLSTEENYHQFYQRTARTYESIQCPDGQWGLRINFIKPDQMRYWTRSMALRDADAVAADITVWGNSSTSKVSEYEGAIVA